MAKFHADVVEQILLRSDVEDLVHYKRVCKSWYSLITSRRFINRHLNHSYNKDRCNNAFAHRRMMLLDVSYRNDLLVGSSNGLVCVVSYLVGCQVGNPLTREAIQLKPPRSLGLFSLCCGFGYDSFNDDYKVVIGSWRGWEQPCFQVLSLKSNNWSDIDVKYIWFFTKVGILCNGSLHWIVKDQNMRTLIAAYDLSKGVFKEIPQPDDAAFKWTPECQLGIVKECLCILRRSSSSSSVVDVWLMKNYDVKESWELLPLDHDMSCDTVHYFSLPNYEGFFHSYQRWDYIGVPIFVQSLVSPHVNARPKQDCNSKRGAKLIKGPKEKTHASKSNRSAKLITKVKLPFCFLRKCLS